MSKKIAEELTRRFEAEGNGFRITIKRTGKTYSCWEQNDGRYLLDDKKNVFATRTYYKHFNSIEEMAQEIERLA